MALFSTHFVTILNLKKQVYYNNITLCIFYHIPLTKHDPRRSECMFTFFTRKQKLFFL